VTESADVSQGGAFIWNISSNNSGTTGFVNPLANPSPNQLVTFCIEINQNIWFNNNPAFAYSLMSLASAPQGTSELPVISGMGSTAATLIEELWAQHFQEVFDTTKHQTGDPTNLSVLAGAFQLAIWKLEYDHTSSQYTDSTGSPYGPVDFTSGFLRVSDKNNVMATTAATWINQLASFNGTAANLKALVSQSQQDQLVELPPDTTPHGSPVPEPGSGLIWLVAGCLAVVARRAGRLGQ
jgi:hypothetical protein